MRLRPSLQLLMTLAVLLALAHPALAQNGPIGAPAGSSNGSIQGLLTEIQSNADWEGTWKPVVKVVVQLLIGVGALVAINSVGHAIQKMVGYVLVFLVAGLLIAFVGAL